MLRLVILCSAVLLMPAATQAQVAFEVASVKPMAENADEPLGASFEFQPGGGFRATGAALRDLVAFAFDLQYFQVQGGPDWASSARFDISARAADARTPRPQIRLMLRALLEGRFELEARRETRTVNVYELQVAARDRRFGPGLRPSDLDCTEELAGRALLDTSAVDDRHAACQPTGRFIAGATTSMTIGRKGIAMPFLARILTSVTRRPVIDKTGLTGFYDVDLTFAPDNVVYVVKGDVPKMSAPPGDGLSITTAVREQLGLRLESTQGPGEILVIEDAQRPEPD